MTGTTWGRQGRHGDDREDGEDGEDTSVMINMLAAIYNILYVCLCVCMHVRVCACIAHVLGQSPIPQTPHHPPAPSPELQGGQITKIQ